MRDDRERLLDIQEAIERNFGIDANIVWSVVERDLPVLKQQLAVLLSE